MRSKVPTVLLAVLAVAVIASPAFAGISDDSSADDSFTPTYYDAQVSPFTFPESKGTPILTELSSAQKTIDISIYYMPSVDVVALLCDLEEQTGAEHVDVRVLILGNPLGMNLVDEMKLMKSLVDAGGEVNVINYKGCPADEKRYTYVHNKYAVIDGEKVVVTSENWTKSNIGSKGNRGWGVTVTSTGYAGYMEGIFENDYAVTNSDVKTFSEVYPDVEPYDPAKLSYTIPEAYPVPTYNAKVAAVVSPTNSKAALNWFLNSAKTSIKVEELDVDTKNAALTGDGPIATMISKANAGVDVKYILNGTYESGGEGDHHDLVKTLNGSTKVKAAIFDKTKPFPQIHNKGIIVDDSYVWVGSVNWTESSFFKNREAAVIIKSEEAAAYYGSYYDTDFKSFYDPNYSDTRFTPVIKLDDWKEGDTPNVPVIENNLSGGEVTVTYAVKGTDDYTSEVPTKAGDYTVKVVIAANNGYEEVSATKDFTITEDHGLLYYIAAGIAALLALVLGVAKKSAKKTVKKTVKSKARKASSGSRKRK